MSRMKDLLGDDEPFYPLAPGYTGLTTSREAAARVLPSAGDLRERVFLAVSERAGTCEEIAERTGIRLGTVRPRVSELRQAGRIRPLIEGGKEVRRRNEGGSPTIVWETGAET